MNGLRGPRALTDTVISIATVVEGDGEAVARFIDAASAQLRGLSQYHEIVLVDNCSEGDVVARVQEKQRSVPNVRLLRLSRRCPSETAFAAALDHSIGDLVVLMEYDRDPLAAVPEMVRLAGEGYDVVIAEDRDGRSESWAVRRLSRIARRVTRLVVGYQVPSQPNYFRLLSRQAANSITRIRSKRRYLEFLNAMVGFRQARIPYTPMEPSGARGRLTVARFLRWLDFLLSNSALPLRGATILALLASAANLLYLLYVVAVTLLKRQVAEGWISTSVMTGTMFLLLFLVLTVLSEYVARLTEEVQERPLYFVEFETSSAVTDPEAGELNVV